MKKLIYFPDINSNSTLGGVDTSRNGGFYEKSAFELVTPPQYQTFLQEKALTLSQLYEALGSDQVAIEVIQDGEYTPLEKSRVKSILLDYQSKFCDNPYARGYISGG